MGGGSSAGVEMRETVVEGWTYPGAVSMARSAGGARLDKDTSEFIISED